MITEVVMFDDDGADDNRDIHTPSPPPGETQKKTSIKVFLPPQLLWGKRIPSHINTPRITNSHKTQQNPTSLTNDIVYPEQHNSNTDYMLCSITNSISSTHYHSTITTVTQHTTTSGVTRGGPWKMTPNF